MRAIKPPIDDPRVWRAGEGRASWSTRSTGFDALDRHLPGGGWPATGLTEILTEHYGIGELSLLMPALARLAGRSAVFGQPVRPMQRDFRHGPPGRGGGAGCIVWVAPPYIPYAPALHSRGIDLDRVLVVRGRTGARGNRDVLWAMEQALKSGSCAAVLAWTRSVDQAPLRRLQLAAEAGRCWTVLFRPSDASRQRSPAVLRMRLTADASRGQTRIEILKCRGGRPGAVSIRFEDRCQIDAGSDGRVDPNPDDGRAESIFPPGGVGARLHGATTPRSRRLAGQKNGLGRAISDSVDRP